MGRPGCDVFAVPRKVPPLESRSLHASDRLFCAEPRYALNTGGVLFQRYFTVRRFALSDDLRGLVDTIKPGPSLWDSVSNLFMGILTFCILVR